MKEKGVIIQRIESALALILKYGGGGRVVYFGEGLVVY